MDLRKRIIVGVLLLVFILAFGTVGYWIIGKSSVPPERDGGQLLLDALYMTVITAATAR
jgi:hypothetical protein